MNEFSSKCTEDCRLFDKKFNMCILRWDYMQKQITEDEYENLTKQHCSFQKEDIGGDIK